MTVSCSALWIGRELSPLAAACLRSFGAVGVPITLYTYERLVDVPSNVEVADANLVVPKEKIFRHKTTGSYAAFSDVFRYRLFGLSSTVYVDTDVYCVRAINDEPLICGWEDDKAINGAVLRLPPNSAILDRMLRIATSNFFFPPWSGRKESLKAIAKHILLGGPSASYMHWGAIGPEALTYYLTEFNLARFALPREHFYPVHWTKVDKFVTPGLAVGDLITSKTSCIHLYNEMLRSTNYLEAPSSSPIKEMLEGRVEV